MNIYALELARLPNTTLRILLRLAKTLLRDKPAVDNPMILAVAGRLLGVIGRVDEVLVSRFIASNPEVVASEVEFDRAVDAVWKALRIMLEQRLAYAHPGLELLSPERAQAAKLEQRREEARKAQRLWARLFAAEGTSFTQTPFLNQVQSMDTLLAVIAKEGLREELISVIGEDPLLVIEACQEQYEDMVNTRLRRKRGTSENLNELRNELRWAIVAYVQAMHLLYDPAKPESAEQVLEALRPILVLREALARAASGGGVEDELLEDFVELEQPEPAEPEQAEEALDEAS